MPHLEFLKAGRSNGRETNQRSAKAEVPLQEIKIAGFAGVRHRANDDDEGRLRSFFLVSRPEELEDGGFRRNLPG